MKNVKLILVFIILTSIFLGCEKEDVLPEENAIILKAKIWYETEHSTLLDDNPSFYGEPDWDNFIQKNDKLYLPLIEKNTLKEQSAFNTQNVNLLFIKSFLVLENDGKLGFQESLKVFVSENNDNFQDINVSINLSYLEYDTKNELTNYNFKEKSIDIRISQQNLKGSSLSAKCTISEYLVQTDTYTDGSKEVYIIGIIYKCDEGTGGGGGVGCEVSGDCNGLPLANEKEPSCKSFDYQNVTNNWQASAISDFGMKVKVGTMTNYQRYTISIPLLTFETWSEDRFGNYMSPGTAAEISAQAIQKAAWDTVKHFQDKYGFTEYSLNNYFEKSLKQRFREMSDGGTVTRGNPYKLLPRKYETGSIGGCE